MRTHCMREQDDGDGEGMLADFRSEPGCSERDERDARRADGKIDPYHPGKRSSAQREREERVRTICACYHMMTSQ